LKIIYGRKYNHKKQESQIKCIFIIVSDKNSPHLSFLKARIKTYRINFSQEWKNYKNFLFARGNETYLNKKSELWATFTPNTLPISQQKSELWAKFSTFLANIMITFYGVQANVLTGKCQHQPSLTGLILNLSN